MKKYGVKTTKAQADLAERFLTPKPKKTKEPEDMEVTCEFSVTIPKTSKRNAIRLMNEAIGTILNELDNAESLFDSFDDIYGGPPHDEIDSDGYAYGFGKPRIV